LVLVEESTDTLELMWVMGLEGVASGSHTSCPHSTHPIISSCVRDPSAKEDNMLILTRKKDEAIRLGEDIRIVFVQIKSGQVRLGIECPSTMRVLREELYEAVRKEILNALSSDPSQLKALPKRQMMSPKTP
jgi:carbon storage regulator